MYILVFCFYICVVRPHRITTYVNCVILESRGAEGHCHGNHFWLSMGYNFSCVIASGTIFDSRGGFLGQAVR